MMTFFNILAGVALFFFGFRFFRKGLNRLFGDRLNQILVQATKNRWRAFCGGVLVATLAPSSTGMATMTVQMMNAARLTAVSALGVILGANVGITMSVQLVSLKLSSWSACFLLPGFILFQYTSHNRWRGIGQCVFALGLVFLGMGMISEHASQIPPDGDLMKILLILTAYPWLLLLVTMGLTLLLQSTTAVIGLAIGLTLGLQKSGANIEDLLPLVFPMVIGASLGMALIHLLIGWKYQESKRMSLANLFLVGGMAILFMVIMEWILLLLGWTGWGLSRQIANLHTGFNVMVALVGLPLMGPVCNLVRRWSESTTRQTAQGVTLVRTSHLDTDALETPWIAMINANREIQHMTDMVKIMIEKFRQAHRTRDLVLVRQIRKSDDQVDEVFQSLQSYLTSMDLNELSEADRKQRFTLLHFAKELESVGDLLEKHMCQALGKKIQTDAMLPDGDRNDLEKAFTSVLERSDLVISVLVTRDPVLAARLIQEKTVFNQWCRESLNRHYRNLIGQRITTPESNSYFLEIMEGLRRISSHFSQLGYAYQSAGDGK